MSVRDRQRLARRESWSSTSSNRRAEHSARMIMGRTRKGIGECNEGHAHITVSMALIVFVGFGVQV